ncbi:MAG: hypothetical protein WCA07_16420 [Gloeobacterales cyanobacterium]
MARAKQFDCLNCCKLSPKEARERYSCWDNQKCHRRRCDARKRDLRVIQNREWRLAKRTEQRIEKIPEETNLWNALKLERGLQVLLEEGTSLIEAVGIPESRLQQMMEDQTALIQHLRSHPSLVTASAQKEQEALIEVFSRYEEKQWDKPPDERITRHRLTAVCYLYTANGRKDGVSHSVGVELWTGKQRIDLRTRHVYGLKLKDIDDWLRGVLDEWKTTLGEPPRYRNSKDCPLRPCPGNLSDSRMFQHVCD